MLVLSRREGESILIGDDIEISVIEVQGDKVRLGITAPKNLRILRRELIEELTSTNALAADVGASLGALAEALQRSSGSKPALPEEK